MQERLYVGICREFGRGTIYSGDAWAGISLALPCLACILSGWVYGRDLRQPVCRRHKNTKFPEAPRLSLAAR
jgi:hypothetical protein